MDYLADYLETEYGLWRDPSDLIEQHRLDILEVLLEADETVLSEVFDAVDSKLNLRYNLYITLQRRYNEAANDFAIE